MSGKGNAAYEKFSREMGEKYGHLIQRRDPNTPFKPFAPYPPAGVERADDNERGGE